jgi:hypothetical protein
VPLFNILPGKKTRRRAALFCQSLLKELFFVIGRKEARKVANLLVLWESAIHSDPVARGILETMLHSTVVVLDTGVG